MDISFTACNSNNDWPETKTPIKRWLKQLLNVIRPFGTAIGNQCWVDVLPPQSQRDYIEIKFS